jgi:hypothetical protein
MNQAVDIDLALAGTRAIFPMCYCLDVMCCAVYRSSMDECFSSTLAQLDPKYAAHLAAMPRRCAVSTHAFST